MSGGPGSADHDKQMAEAGKAVLILAAIGAALLTVLAGIVKLAGLVGRLFKKR